MILYSDSLCYFFQIAKAWQVLKKSYCNYHTCYINRWTNTKMYFGSSKPQHTYRFLHDSLEGNLNELNDFINDYFIYNLKLFTILIKRDRLVWNFSLLWTTIPTLFMVRLIGKAITFVKCTHCIWKQDFLSVNLLVRQWHVLAMYLCNR